MQILFCVSIRKIKRIIFLEIQKLTRDENGDLNYSLIPTHQAKQIAGRAGRYGSGENVGLVTAHTEKKMIELKEIIQQDLEDIQVKTNREITLHRSTILMICSLPNWQVDWSLWDISINYGHYAAFYMCFQNKAPWLHHISTNKV